MQSTYGIRRGRCGFRFARSVRGDGPASAAEAAAAETAPFAMALAVVGGVLRLASMRAGRAVAPFELVREEPTAVLRHLVRLAVLHFLSDGTALGQLRLFLRPRPARLTVLDA